MDMFFLFEVWFSHYFPKSTKYFPLYHCYQHQKLSQWCCFTFNWSCRPEVFHRKPPVPVSFLIKLQAEACNFITKETPAQVFSYKFCEIFKNTSCGCFCSKRSLNLLEKSFYFIRDRLRISYIYPEIIRKL